MFYFVAVNGCIYKYFEGDGEGKMSKRLYRFSIAWKEHQGKLSSCSFQFQMKALPSLYKSRLPNLAYQHSNDNGILNRVERFSLY